jgi:hypothetical protein
MPVYPLAIVTTLPLAMPPIAIHIAPASVISAAKANTAPNPIESTRCNTGATALGLVFSSSAFNSLIDSSVTSLPASFSFSVAVRAAGVRIQNRTYANAASPKEIKRRSTKTSRVHNGLTLKYAAIPLKTPPSTALSVERYNRFPVESSTVPTAISPPSPANS